VGARTGLDAVEKRKIPSPRRESKPGHPIVQIAESNLKINVETRSNLVVASSVVMLV
jgi:hypothetical protein